MTLSGSEINMHGSLRIRETGTSPTYYTIFNTADQSSNITYTLPSSISDGVLSNSSGTLSWTPESSLLPSGTEGYTMYYDGDTSSWVQNSDLFYDDVNGRVGIGTLSPDHLLDISGNARIEGNNYLYFGGTGSADMLGNIYHDGTDFVFSDSVSIAGSSSVISNSAGDITIDSASGNISLNGDSITNLNKISGFATAEVASDTTFGFGVNNTSTASTADGLVIQLGPTSNPGTGNNFIEFRDGDGTAVGNIDGNGSGGISYNTSGADYAEYFPSYEELSKGYVVSLDNEGKVTKAKEAGNLEDSEFLGVVSTAPGFVGGKPDDGGTYSLIGLLGKVPTLIMKSAAEEVTPGDYVNMSAMKGIGKKAIERGTVIGKVLEDTSAGWGDTTCKQTNTIEELNSMIANDHSAPDELENACYSLQVGNIQDEELRNAIKEEHNIGDENKIYVGKVLTYVKLRWYEPKDVYDQLEEMVASYEKGQLGQGISSSNVKGWNVNESANAISTVYDVVGHRFRGTYGTFDILRSDRLEVSGDRFVVDSGGNVYAKGQLKLEEGLFVNEDVEIQGDLIVKGKVKSTNAGHTQINSGKTTLLIDNATVTEKSRVLVTPTTPTCGKTIYVKEKRKGQGFVVALEGGSCSQNIEFDWWIVEEL
jgi:hypothetical protein